MNILQKLLLIKKAQEAITELDSLASIKEIRTHIQNLMRELFALAELSPKLAEVITQIKKVIKK